jgi:hypothetical protein
MLRQLATHQKRVRLFPGSVPVVSFAAAYDGKSSRFVESERGAVIFFNLEKYGSYTTGREMAEMGQEQIT